MAKICPFTGSYVLYLDCLECEEKECEKVTEDEKEEDKDGE